MNAGVVIITESAAGLFSEEELIGADGQPIEEATENTTSTEEEAKA
jgi:hypothetical protein